MVLHFAFPNSVAAKRKQCVPVFATEADARHTTAVGDGENDLSWAIVGTDLNTAASRNELPAFDGVTQ